MDLMELRNLYEQSVLQIEVLEVHLLELLHRRQHARETGSSEFDYLEFKITILRGVLHMYEQYCDQKWTLLQKESTLALEEVLYGDVRNRATPMTPPLTPPGSPQDHSSPHNQMDWSESEIHIHMIPAPLSPIRDMDEFILTPPASPQSQDRYYFSRNLMNSSFTDLPVTRDV